MGSDSLEKEYCLVFDTNFIRLNDKDIESFDEFVLHRFDKLNEFLDDYKLSDKITLLIPEIVLLELTHQKKSKLNSWINTIKEYSENFSQIKDFLNKLSEIDVDKHIEKLKQEKIKDLEIVSIPEDKKRLFEEILIQCVEKRAPFIEGDSDKGFKDAILFISLKEYSVNFSETTFVLFSKDKAFSDDTCSKKLIEEFSKTGNNLKIESNYDVEGFIKKTFKLDVELMNYIYNTIIPKVEEDLSNIKQIKLLDKTFQVSNFEIDPTSTSQEELNDTQVKLTIVVKISYIDDDSKKDIPDFVVEFIIDKYKLKIIEQKPYNYEVIENDSY